jgi:glycine/D-amino acid oxidase-like deaminating enzyme/nitrite reductase/ring-hydroxylating ferredoxin subunit
MDTTSLWQGRAVKLACQPTLQTDITVDVAVIGAGITGLTAAMQLAAAGQRVALLEARRIGGSSTGHSTGNLYAPVDLGLREIASKHGEDTMRQVVQSRASAVDAIEATANTLGLQCGYTRLPWHLLATAPGTRLAVEDEFKAATAAGLPAQMLDQSPLPVSAERILQIPGQAQFQPLDYVRQLAQRIAGERCLVFENTPVTKLDDAAGELTTPQGSVRFGAALLATHTPVGIHLVQAKLDVVREYAVALRLEQPAPPPGIYWLIGNECYSLRVFSDKGLAWLVAVGAAHPTGKQAPTSHPYDALERYARSHFKLGEVDYRWSAQRYRSQDLLPYVGKNIDATRTWIATGFSGDGLTYGTLAGLLIADQLLGHDNPWSALYSPSRLSSEKRPAGFEQEQSSASPAPVLHLDAAALTLFNDLPLNEARQMEYQGKKLAAYRCEDGRVLVVGAKCSHMGCDIQWNGAETSWDCHCHGSRFAPDGQVLEGPALAPLAHAQELPAADSNAEPPETGAEE